MKQKIIKGLSKENSCFVFVKALILGDYGFHKDITKYGPGSSYTVTHLPTGMIVKDGIEYAINVRALVKNLANMTTRYAPEIAPWNDEGLQPSDTPREFINVLKQKIGE